MGKLIVKRNPEWNSKGRHFQIHIDGILKGIIADGETKEFDMEAGKHRFNAKIDWCGSKVIEFEILESEDKTIKLTGFKYGNLILPVMLAVMLVYFFTKYFLQIETNLLILIGGSMFLYLMYFMTIGKNRYIRATELTN